MVLPNVVFLSRIPPWHHVTLSHHVSSWSSQLWQFLRLPFFFDDLDNFGEYWSDILQECPSIGICLEFCSWLDWIYGLSTVLIPSCHSDLSLLTLTAWLRSCYLFLHRQWVLLSLPFLSTLFGRKSPYAAHTSGVRDCPPLP